MLMLKPVDMNRLLLLLPRGRVLGITHPSLLSDPQKRISTFFISAVSRVKLWTPC